MSWSQRTYVLAALLAAVALVTTFLLFDIFSAVFFAITVAYILYPVRSFLRRRGLSSRLAAGLSTLLALVAVVVLFSPLIVSVYVRRSEFFEFLEELPETLSGSFVGMEYEIDVGQTLEQAEVILQNAAVDLLAQMPVILLNFFVFILVVYALLLRPDAVRAAILKPVPVQYQDIVFAFHRRTRSILYAIYVLQAAVGLGTFLIGYPFFILMGYDSAFTLAVMGGILQFVPVAGPILVLAGLAGLELVAGEVVRAALVFGLGGLLVGVLPDVLIRPRLARLTAGIPGSLYFVGFFGGLLSVGALGIIAGPLAVALVAEAVRLLVSDSASAAEQQELEYVEQPTIPRSDDQQPSTE
jgi:predicted PurR-regulated permease PerM